MRNPPLGPRGPLLLILNAISLDPDDPNGDALPDGPRGQLPYGSARIVAPSSATAADVVEVGDLFRIADSS